MAPEEKQKVATVVEKHNVYTVKCCEELQDSCHILGKDMQHLHVCLECAKKNPTQLDIEASVASTIPDAAPTYMYLMESQMSLKDINHGLNSFLLHPLGMTGEKKF